MKRLPKLAMTAAVAALAVTSANAQSVGSACGCPAVSSRTQVLTSTLVDVNGNLLTASSSLTCNNLYVLNSRMYVANGQDLFIEPGTVVKEYRPPPAVVTVPTRLSSTLRNSSTVTPSTPTSPLSCTPLAFVSFQTRSPTATGC